MRMRADDDIAAEAASLQHAMESLDIKNSQQYTGAGVPAGATPVLRHVRLNWKPNQGGHKHSSDTIALLQEVGKEGIARFTEAFYQKAFRDPHLDRFIREHQDPHGERFASWIVEKFGVGEPWSSERAGTHLLNFNTSKSEYDLLCIHLD